MELGGLGRSLSEKEQLFMVDLIICLNKARAQFPGNRNRLDALVEEVGEVATALMENEGVERVRSECIDVACTAMRLALEGDAAYTAQGSGLGARGNGRVRVGYLDMFNMGNGKIWIGEAGGGEGGEFPLIDVAAIIQKFYAENF